MRRGREVYVAAGAVDLAEHELERLRPVRRNDRGSPGRSQARFAGNEDTDVTYTPGDTKVGSAKAPARRSAAGDPVKVIDRITEVGKSYPSRRHADPHVSQGPDSRREVVGR